MEKFTKSDVLTAMAKAVEIRGKDYIYQSPIVSGQCVYTTPEGAPSCIVGQVAFLLSDVVFEDFKKVDDWQLDDEIGWYADEDGLTGGGMADIVVDKWFTPQAVRELAYAQGRQDAGASWGEVYENVS